MTYYNSRGIAMPESAAEQARVAGTSAGNETINAPAGHSSLSGEGGGDLLIGNNLDNRHWITHPTDRVVEQADGGVDTMIGWTSIKLAPNVENLIVNGQLNYAVGNDLANLIIVDDNTHFVWGAGGDDVLVGGAIQRTTFMVRAGEGSDVIYNWNGNSQLQLWGYGFETAEDIREAMTEDGDDVVLKLSATETLTFRDETLESFQDRQFLLPLDTSLLGELTFHDEFDSLQVYDHSLQTGQWRSDFGGNLRDEWAYTLTSNGERQVYTTHNFYGQGERQFDNYDALSVSGGLLTIRAERLEDSDREAAWGREYSSGMLNTFGIFEQQYGYFEMRAELPSALGAWPAFWMIPFPYAAQVEADIMEGLAATPNVDYRRAWGGSENLYDNGYKVDPTGMHTYGMLWTPTQVTFYFDGVAVMQTTTPANWDQPMAMIVNLAVGGWGGEPNSLQFPAEMKIDYVRAYELADGSTVTETGTPEPPAATMRNDGGLTSGATNAPVVFDGSGQAVTTAKIEVHDAKPTTLPSGQAFVIWEDAGAVFGAVSNGQTLGEATPLMAGDSRVFTGSGTWLTDGKVALAYMMPDGGEPTAWVMIFDPARGTFTKHELGVSRGDIDIVALKNGGFAASWETPDGDTMGRAYDAFAYDGKGWYGPAREVAGDFTGVTANGEVIATTPSGQQQLYDVINPPRGINAVVSIGPMAGVTHEEGDAGGTLYTFTVIRDWDQSEKVTVGWQVRGQGANPATALDFEGDVLPSGTVTFEINQTTAYVQVWVAGDATAEANEEFLVTLVNPVGAKLGQATATGFITDDDTGGGGPTPTQPTLAFAQSSLTLAEGDSGSTAFAYTVTRTGDTSGASTVNWSVTGSGANPASAADFAGAALPSGTLTFAAGETSKTITVQVAGDTTVEPNETFRLTLSGASGATVSGSAATGTITDDDSAPPPPTETGTLVVFAGQSNAGGAYMDRSTLVEAWEPDPLTLIWDPSTSTWVEMDPGANTGYGQLSEAWAAEVQFALDFRAEHPTEVLRIIKAAWGGTQIDEGAGVVDWSPASNGELFDRTAAMIADAADTLGGARPVAVFWGQGEEDANYATTSAEYAQNLSGLFQAIREEWLHDGDGRIGFFQITASPPYSSQVRTAQADVDQADPYAVSYDAGGLPVQADGLHFTAAAHVAIGHAYYDMYDSWRTNGELEPNTPPPVGGSGGQVFTSPGPGSTVVAGPGNDTINASQGADVLTGGAGADKFTWTKEPWSPATVTDFVAGTDKLDLSALFQAAGYTGSDPVADKYISLLAQGADTLVLFDRDGTATGQQWPNYIIKLQGVTGVTWAQLSGGGASNPPPAPTGSQVSLTTTSLSFAEGDSGSTAFSFTVSRSGSTSGSSTVTWSVTGSGSNPATAADFAGGALPSGTLTFAAGETTKTLTVQVAGDTAAESSETFTLTLASPSSGTTLGAATATGTITNDDSTSPPPSGSGQVYNSPGPGSTVTAGAGDDTINASQGADTLTGGAGADSFAFRALPWSAGKITDFVVGTDRLDLSAVFQASGYTGTDPIADGRMRLDSDGAGGTQVFFDRDAPNSGDWPFHVTTLQGVNPAGLTWAQLLGSSGTTPPPASSAQVSLTTTTLSLAEGDSGSTAFSFTVTRTGATSGTSSASWTVAGSGANPASADDFAGGALPSGTVTFGAGETSKTIVVNVAGDATAEPGETFTVTLASPSSGTTLGTATATGTITDDDDDAPPPSGAGQVFNSSQWGDTLTGTAGDDTLNAGQGPDRLTGAGGADHFVFANPVWNAGQITDFTPGTDKIDLRGLFDQAGYAGTNPVADGWLILQAANGGTQVIVDMDGPNANGDWPITVTTLVGVAPGQLGAGDWIVQ
ncbi:Calx-beta domain-containing protein [Phenylobacterium sp. J367]|uniref:Calx-beta domain-containing protein n=1 Tax=Phenylobacterium sp. J367 TaxID=2898435 RepID=UPI00215180C5|nr:Calx-beta domain-containing protein [Phenylobacterium sp. J367]MCR5879331.1 family 16 glycosylhydrolase [Phenylobacterium sp. J367]